MSTALLIRGIARSLKGPSNIALEPSRPLSVVTVAAARGSARSVRRTRTRRPLERRAKLRILFLAGAIAAVVSIAAYWTTTRPACVEAGSGMRGEARVLADGKVLYFNGTCWTTKPMPPNDMPF